MELSTYDVCELRVRFVDVCICVVVVFWLRTCVASKQRKLGVERNWKIGNFCESF